MELGKCNKLYVSWTMFVPRNIRPKLTLVHFFITFDMTAILIDDLKRI